MRAADRTFRPKVVVRGVITIMPFSPLSLKTAIVVGRLRARSARHQIGRSDTFAVRSISHSTPTTMAANEPPRITHDG